VLRRGGGLPRRKHCGLGVQRGKRKAGAQNKEKALKKGENAAVASKEGDAGDEFRRSNGKYIVPPPMPDGKKAQLALKRK